MQKNCLGYPVEIEEDIFGESTKLADIITQVCGDAGEGAMIGTLLVADINVVQKCEGLGSKIGRYLKAHNIELAGPAVVLTGGEKLKSDGIESAKTVINAMIDAKLGKNDCVLAIGGGTLLDVVGYAAAQVRGGVNLIRIPTTLAAMTDAAFATYAALDSESVKDALRVPSVPAAVVIDPQFATLVLDGVWGGGFSEAVRVALMCDAPLMKKIERYADKYSQRDVEAMKEIVKATVAVRLKKPDTPFGKWISARLEAMAEYKLPHGYATAISICMETAYAVKQGYAKQSLLDDVYKLLLKCKSLEGMVHSQHLLVQAEKVMWGLDAMKLTTGNTEILLPTAVGKLKIEAEPNREVYMALLKNHRAIFKDR